MAWLPHFLNTLPAAIAAAVVVPLLLVLYFLKLRRREVSVSSTLLWKKAIQDLQVNAPFQRLRRNLLLFLQLLLLLLLCLALARPVVNYTPGGGQVNVVLIDRSASMSANDINGKTRLEEAKRRAKDFVSGLDRHAMTTVIAFDDRAEIVQTFTTDAAALRRAIDSIAPADCPSRLKMAYQLADAQSTFIQEQNRPNVVPEIRLYSDGRVLDASELAIRGNVTYEKIGSEDAPNVAIVALNAKRNYERPTELQVFARLANFGPKPVEAEVRLSVDGQPSRSGVVQLAPERWSDEAWLKAHPGEKDEKYVARDSIEFKLELLTGGVIKVEQMCKEGDCLAADDAAQVVVPPPKSLRVLLVTDGNYFLEKAIDSLNLQKPATLLPTRYEEAFGNPKSDPTQYDVIIFDRYQPQKLPPAGNFVYFGAVPPNTRLKAVMEGSRTVMLNDVQVLDWKRDHPILRYLSLSKLYAARAIKLEVPLEAEVLMDGVKGPLIVLHREGRSTHLVVAFDLLESTWPLRVSFPVFMYNAMQFLAVGSQMDVRQSYQPGATIRIPRANLQKVSADLKEVVINGPIYRRVPVPAQGDFVLPALDRVGLYTLQPPIPQYEQLAVNLLDANESNLMPADTPPGHLGTTAMATQGKSRLELWWWLVACAALPLLMIEWWVYTRRVHL